MISRGPLVTWPFDVSVYAGLVLVFFGHAWLARGAPDARRKHTIYFLGAAERLELTHRAQSAEVFAAGALHAAAWLVRAKPGRYSMRDVLRG